MPRQRPLLRAIACRQDAVHDARRSSTPALLHDEFLAVADTSSDTDWFQENAAAFIEVCELFGQTAAQHHDLLVKRFIEGPAADLKPEHLAGVTASGPPLPALIRSLEVLKDMRVAAKRCDLVTRHDDLARLASGLRRGPSRTDARQTQ